MSLPWNKAVRLRIGAKSVQGLVHPAWSPRMTQRACRHDIAAESAEARSLTTVHTPSAVENALSAAFSDLGATPGSRIKLAQMTISDARVHFDVVPGDYADLSERQLQSVATVCVNEVLGDQAAGSAVRWQLQKDTRHLLITSIDSSTIDQVMRAAQDSGATDVSLQPEFCQRWNTHAHLLKNGSGVFASLCEDHVVVATVASGSITSISSGSTQRENPEAPSTPPTSSALDERVNRLLSSEGQDSSKIPSFLLVVLGDDSVAVSERWQVVTVGEALI